MLGGLLPEGMMFPFDFGFVMVLMDAPAHAGCLIEVRLIGVIMAKQTQDGKTESKDRLLGVAVQGRHGGAQESGEEARLAAAMRNNSPSS